MNTDYDEGFKAGLAASKFTGDYWLRCYAGQAMQGILASIGPDMMEPESNRAMIVSISLDYAKALLEEVKRGEQ